VICSANPRTVPILRDVLFVHCTVSDPELLTEQSLTEENVICKVLGNIRRIFESSTSFLA
jgi:hypothetical protein